MYSRSFIRAHDRTSVGGDIQTLSNGVMVGADDRPVCFEGDPVACPGCNGIGVTRCISPFRPWTGHDGRQVNLDGDLCICGCLPPPRLIASAGDMTMGFDAHELAGMAGTSSWLAHAGFIQAYDEQVQLHGAGAAVAGMPWFIEFEDGRTASGHAGEDGLLPRLETEGAGAYRLYWGDDALEKTAGGQ
ncbi:MAG: PAAR domain-containing protein [Polaromonas sp.]|nr:PAAR domain-containing protein [Polaromonas sp.]